MTFLFTDIQGSTSLLRQLGPERYNAALANHRQVLREAFAAHEGVEIDAQGDAFFVGFPTATGAIAAARLGQAALASGPITVRMGLHTGAPLKVAEGYVGIDVHRGARVAALAHGGQVILTAATATLIEDEPLRDLGRHRLKDFDAPAQLYQLGTAQFPPLRTPGAVSLPTPATRFLGREREILEAAEIWLDRQPRVLTIVGPGGTGKTRLSIELARFLAEESTGGTVFVPLAPVRDAALVVPLIAEHLGASGDTAPAIGARVGDKETLILLDNLEQLLPGVAQPLADLLAEVPALRILATSREPLRIGGEIEFDLPPLDEPEAARLFVERARAVRADVVDSPAVHELILRLDGLPLAIELAAARVKLLGPDQLLERIGQRLDLLKGARDVDDRHATLRATITWSYDLLDESEQQLFARLAVHRGGCTLETAEAVCGADVDTLSSLLDKSLVRRRSDTDGSERFWMLETIREFARERLALSGEENELRRVQADRLIELADRAGARAVIDVPRTWKLDLVAPEIDNVRAVLDWALDHDPDRGLFLATWLEAYWVVRDPSEGTSWLEQFLARAPTAEPRLRASALRAQGGTLDIVGESIRAAPCYREALSLLDENGETDSPDAEHLRFRIAANMMMRGEGETAWPLLEAALETSRSRGLRLGEAQALGFLVYRARADDNLELAAELALESAAIAREVGWTWWESGQLESAAAIERDLGKLADATEHARRSLELAAELGDRQGIVFAGTQLAILAGEEGDARKAGRLWGAVCVEIEAGNVGQWEQQREELTTLVLRAEGPTFREGLAEGALLRVVEAAGPGSSQTEP